MLCQNCRIDQSASTVADWLMPYGWPCIDRKICNGNFITWPYWNAKSWGSCPHGPSKSTGPVMVCHFAKMYPALAWSNVYAVGLVRNSVFFLWRNKKVHFGKSALFFNLAQRTWLLTFKMHYISMTISWLLISSKESNLLTSVDVAWPSKSLYRSRAGRCLQ